MQLLINNNINKSLSPSYRLLKPKRNEIDSFKQYLAVYFSVINSLESEENLKTHLMDFLKKQYGRQHLIEQQERIDFVIRNGDKSTNAGVLVESKKSSNAHDMITESNINKKSLHELVLYFMKERHKGNTDIKFVIICSEFVFYVFEAKEFEHAFWNNKYFKKDFIEWIDGKKTDYTTDFFYNNIAKPYINKTEITLNVTYFDIRNCQNVEDDNQLIPLFKILSPEHLLKKSFANDSNSLNEEFYNELLHIMGLYEIKEKGQYVIKRLPKVKRHNASLLENAIDKIQREQRFNDESFDVIYGQGKEEHEFNIALELCITWINRLLFLKLLEAQIVAYHNGDKSYCFLKTNFINDYTALEDLFFGVLALQQHERAEHIKTKYAKVPYLNSSLFEKTSLELILGINQLNYQLELPLHTDTVLLNEQNKPKYTKIKTLEYLFEFLDAYDFSSEGGEEIQEESKTLINASVLGLIFEKINGYKDGSIFTPGYITMYMSQKVIEKTIIEKFVNLYPTWKLQSLDDLKNYLVDYRSKSDLLKFNSIINSIKICDPAVGSGHFLVSCLNELIAMKSKLGILADSEGNRINEYEIYVDNDELIIADANTAELFKYQVINGIVPPRLQHIQKTIFNEKKNLIENCLFGVDINQNSVKICSLRLWIELLKNAYYKENNGYTELETLPNIDINIKCGNSLLHRFKLEQPLADAFNKAGATIDEYKKLVNDYKEMKNKQAKYELVQKIAHIKSCFKQVGVVNIEKEMRKQIVELYQLEDQDDLFGLDITAENNKKHKMTDLQKRIKELEAKKQAYLADPTFFNALEWRFEFPEVLNDDGEFIGFDIVIANPPYMRVQEIERTQSAQKQIYEANYHKTARGSYDLANLFFELAGSLCAKDGNNIFIFPHKLFNSANGEGLREYLINSRTIKHISHFGANMVFDNADTYTCIALFNKKLAESFDFARFAFGSEFKKELKLREKYRPLHYENIEQASALYGSNQWIFFDDAAGFDVFNQIYQQQSNVAEKFNDVFQGIATSNDTLYVVQKLAESESTYTIKVNPKNKVMDNVEQAIFEVEKQFFKPFLMGKDVHRYASLHTDKLVFFPYILSEVEGAKTELVTLAELQQHYPLTHKYVMHYETAFKARESGKAGRMTMERGEKNQKQIFPAWHGYIYPKNLHKFNQPKLSSMEICAKHPNVTVNADGIYHTTKVYSLVKADDNNISYHFYTAIFNSKLFWWFLKHTGDTLQGDSRTIKTNYINPFPLPAQVSNQQENELVALVEQIMCEKQLNPKADTSELEAKIDTAIYSLYGLSEAHIATITSSV